jgi:hypothetical protein
MEMRRDDIFNITLKLKHQIKGNMTPSNKEKTVILISRAISLYSIMMQEGKTPEHQSEVDFILKNIPHEYKDGLPMELIDDVFSFVSENHMELS